MLSIWESLEFRRLLSIIGKRSATQWPSTASVVRNQTAQIFLLKNTLEKEI